MKHISPEAGQWASSVLTHLTLIKQKGRYPLSLRMKGMVLIWSCLAIFLGIILIQGLQRNVYHSSEQYSILRKVPYIYALILVILAYSIINYIRSIYFRPVVTGLSKTANFELLRSFLEAQHLMVLVHPESKDVLAIMSRAISSGDERKEMMVFVIDERRILINSHFTDQGWRLTAVRRHDRQMAAQLSEYIQKAKAQRDSLQTHRELPQR